MMDSTETSDPPRRTRAPGDRSRRHVVEQAARLATIEGLDGLSVGRLATACGMPKSSVYQLFGSKEHIQLAAVEAARATFAEEVVLPARAASAPGIQRLLALCDGYLDYVENRVFPGGCFFVGAAAEVGGREGRLHDRVATVQQEWRDLLRHEAERAAERSELPGGADPAQVAFELGALVAGTNIISILHDDRDAIGRARVAVRTLLGVA